MLALAGLLLVAACAGDDDSEAVSSATVPAAPTTTTTTNPYAIPELIDAAYVNRVLAGLDAAVGEVVRLVAATRAISPEAFDRVKALYSGEEVRQRRLDALSLAVASGLRGYRSPPGNQVSTVQEVITARVDCIFARITRDFSAVVSVERDMPTEWIALKPIAQPPPVAEYNSTGWTIDAEGVRSDGSPLVNRCLSG